MAPNAETVPLLQVLRLSGGYLASAGVATPRLEAEVLLSFSLGVSRLDLYLQFERPLTQAELEPIRVLLRSRAGGRPLAYLVGEKEFFGIPFAVSEAVLVPRPETELLVERGITIASGMGPGARVADLGTGSGCIAISMAATVDGIEVEAVDSQEAALAVASLNVRRQSLDGRVHLHLGNWAEPLRGKYRYQLVVSNPPYITSDEFSQLDQSVRDYEPRAALDGGADGLDSYRSLIPAVSSIAAPGGFVLLECDPNRISAVAEICQAEWPQASQVVHPDLSGRDRLLELALP
jgi:release factor glutamine methyltransferase